jgi:hypothetical protein
MQFRLDKWCHLPSAPTMLILAGVIAFPGYTGAQQLGSKAETEEAFFKVRTKFNEQLEAMKPFNAKEHEPIAKIAAQYYTYRVTWPAVQFSKDPTSFGLPKVQDEFLKEMEKSVVTDKSGMKSPKNKEFMRAFAKSLSSCFQEVLDQDLRSAPQAVTTASLMLQSFGKCKQEDAGDFLKDVVKDTKKYHAFIRMCAVKGLGEIFPAYSPKQREVLRAENINPADKLKRDLERLDTVRAFIQNPMELPKEATSEQLDAYHYLRREGIKALAQIGMPALEVTKNKVIGPAAFYLIEVLAGDQNGRPYTFAERLEAAIGVCQLQAGEIESYRPEVGIYFVGLTLAEMEKSYANDWTYFSGRKDPKEAPRQPNLPWKAVKTRVEQALKELVANVGKDSQAGKKAELLQNQVKSTLVAMGTLQAINVQGTLRQMVETKLRPAQWEIYAGNKEFLIREPAK